MNNKNGDTESAHKVQHFRISAILTLDILQDFKQMLPYHLY